MNGGPVLTLAEARLRQPVIFIGFSGRLISGHESVRKALGEACQH